MRQESPLGTRYPQGTRCLRVCLVSGYVLSQGSQGVRTEFGHSPRLGCSTRYGYSTGYALSQGTLLSGTHLSTGYRFSQGTHVMHRVLHKADVIHCVPIVTGYTSDPEGTRGYARPTLSQGTLTHVHTCFCNQSSYHSHFVVQLLQGILLQCFPQ